MYFLTLLKTFALTFKYHPQCQRLSHLQAKDTKAHYNQLQTTPST